jgi:uncharacterized protein YecE (DUF72 family)
MGHIAVGTSGWSYDHWENLFYPEGLARSRWFGHYASIFSTVEVNYSFYRLPSASTIEAWARKSPDGFRFAVKGSQLITHRLRLRDCDEAVGLFYERVLGLGEQLGAVLWQLPPDQLRDEELIDSFLAKLPASVPVAVEFRDPSWMRPSVYDVLRRHAAALVWVSSEHMPRVFADTAPLVYARFHGLGGDFSHDYTAEELKPWVEALRGKDGYAYFNNDGLARAPSNALLLRDLLAG